MVSQAKLEDKGTVKRPEFAFLFKVTAPVAGTPPRTEAGGTAPDETDCAMDIVHNTKTAVVREKLAE